jgi:hypothetical protein
MLLWILKTSAWFSYRFRSISLILGAHQRLHWSLVQTEDAVLEFNHQMPLVLVRTISVHTLFSMEMEVGPLAIMYQTCCISTQFLGDL